MGVILSCKTSQCHQCRTSGEERTGGGKGIGFPSHCSNGKENQNDLKSKLRYVGSGKKYVGAGSNYCDSAKSRSDVELPKRNGLPNPLGTRSRRRDRKRSSFLSDLFSVGENISRDGNVKFKPLNQGEPQALQPMHFFLVQSPIVEKRNHPSPTDLSSYFPTSMLESSLDRSNIGKFSFSDSAIRKSPLPNVDVIQLDKDHQIYICSLGLTNEQCDSIVASAEKCAATRGRYNAYTYAKQTLGCRDNDDLAVECIVPTYAACQTIFKVIHPKFVEMSIFAGQVIGSLKPANHRITLDHREPHIVKYDTAEEQNQSLEMHTDKSDWTFLIALSEYGNDYEGGGTFFESTQTAYHLMKGQCLIFRGTLKHCGLKITNGRRFLLVGFLVTSEESNEVEKIGEQ